MYLVRLFIILLWVFTLQTTAYGLPLGFGHNQGDLEFSEQVNEDFFLYHDQAVKAEGSFIFNNLNQAKPYIEDWIGAKRDRPLIVISSAHSSNASFANFITDAIELQTRGIADRDLHYHEFVHTTMYEHFNSFLLGPAGSVIYLPWMPAWWLEGLAESLSVSVGSARTAAIERTHALNKKWPDYDRLHSLYAKYGFSEEGYATSGAYVSYILRKAGFDNLKVILKDFSDYAQPWWWPWAAVPFNGFMPMDEALAPYFDKDGEELYEAYIKDAETHWNSQRRGVYLQGGRQEKALKLKSVYFMWGEDNHVYTLQRHDGEIHKVPIKFTDDSPWAIGYETSQGEPTYSDPYEYTYAKDTNGQTYAVETMDEDLNAVKKRARIVIKDNQGNKIKEFASGLPPVEHLFVGPSDVFMLIKDLDKTQFCYISKSSKLQPKEIYQNLKCPLGFEGAKRLSFLGQTRRKKMAGNIWLRMHEQTASTDSYKIFRYDTFKHKILSLALDDQATPLRVVDDKEFAWVLVSGKTHFAVRGIDSKGQCHKQVVVEDLVENFTYVNGDFYFGINELPNKTIKRVPATELDFKDCTPLGRHETPLMAAISGKSTQGKQAFASADLWGAVEQSNVEKDESGASNTPGKEDQAGEYNAEREWRGRYVATIPWLGGEDPSGLQFGFISIPLMDHLQNETLRLTFLYGLKSQFPGTHLVFTTTRFTPDINLSLYRQQTYNGVDYIDSVGKLMYYDEKGMTGDVSYGFKLSRASSLALNWGFKYAYLVPYIGYYQVRHGNLFETNLGLSLSGSIGNLGLSTGLNGTVAPEADFNEFDYNKLRFSTNATYSGIPLFNSRFSTGFEYSRTRGKKMRVLKELYSPLKTFIPGSGGGVNQANYGITGPGVITASIRGDSQARLKSNWIIPLLPDINKQIWLFYFERLDLSNFYNYGAAWNGTEPRDLTKLVAAHGHNLDLQFENKGVRLNAGAGVGKVHGFDYDVFVKFGFDAFF